jgi:hypothetical protein
VYQKMDMKRRLYSETSRVTSPYPPRWRTRWSTHGGGTREFTDIL